MSAETVGLLAYGLVPAPVGVSWDLQTAAHAGCHVSAFCRNPLHPGPCKGWKHTLKMVAPGVHKQLEEDRLAKLAEKRAAKKAATSTNSVAKDVEAHVTPAVPVAVKHAAAVAESASTPGAPPLEIDPDSLKGRERDILKVMDEDQAIDIAKKLGISSPILWITSNLKKEILKTEEGRKLVRESGVDPDGPTPAQVQNKAPIQWRYNTPGKLHKGTAGIPDAKQRKSVIQAIKAYATHNGSHNDGQAGKDKRAAEPEVNSALRGNIPMTPERAAMVTALDHAMESSKLGEPITVFRGFSQGTRVLPKGFESKNLVGHEWSDEAFTSTTVDKGSAGSYAGHATDSGFAARIRVPAGMGAIAIADPGGLDDEGEMVLPRDTRYKVVGDFGVDKYGIRWLDVEALPGVYGPVLTAGADFGASAIGMLAYGLAPSPLTTGVPRWLLASGAYTSMSWDLQMQHAHAGCHLSAFCRNPLHPGPCKGWKHHLGLVSPGALHALEKIRHEKLEENRKSKVKVLQDAGHAVPKNLLKPIVYDPTKNKHILQPDKITPGMGIPTKGLTPESAKATLDAIPTKAQVGAKLDAKHAAEAAAAGPKMPTKEDAQFLTLKQAGLTVGDKVWVHTKHGEGKLSLGMSKKSGPGDKPVLATVTHAGHMSGVNNVGKSPVFELHDKNGEAVSVGTHAAKHWMSPVSGGSFEDHSSSAPAAVPTPNAEPSGSEHGKPTYMTIAKAGLKDGDKVFLHGKGKSTGEPQLVTVRKADQGGYFFEDADGNKVMHPHQDGVPDAPVAGGTASKWLLSPAPGKSFPDHSTPAASPAPSSGLSGFEKGEATKIAKLTAPNGPSEKHTAQATALGKFFNQSLGKTHTPDKQAYFEGQAKSHEAAGKPIASAEMIDAGSKKIAAKLFSKIGISDKMHQTDLENALKRDVHEGVNEGKPTPVLDAAKEAGIMLGQDKPGTAQALADAVHKKLGISGHDDTPAKIDSDGLSKEPIATKPAAGTFLGKPIVQMQPGPKQIPGASMTDQITYEHAMKTIDGGNDNLSAEARAGMLAKLPKSIYQDHMDQDEKLAVQAQLIKAHGELAAMPGGDVHHEDAMAKAAAKFEELTGKPMPGAVKAQEPDVLQQLLDGVPEATGPVPGADKAPHVKEAIDYANGFKAATDTVKLGAYQKLTPEELASLSPNSQKLMAANLTGMTKKFLDNKKIAAAQGVLTKLQVAQGGGAGAGGSSAVATPTIAAMDHAGLAAQAAANAYAHGFIKTGPGSEGYQAFQDIVEHMHGNSAQSAQTEDAFQAMGKAHAEKLLKDAGIPHSAGLGHTALPHLVKEMVGAFKGETAPTPLADALHNTSPSHLDPFLKAFHNHPHLGSAGVTTGGPVDKVKVAHDLAKHADSSKGTKTPEEFAKFHSNLSGVYEDEQALNSGLGGLYGGSKLTSAIDSLNLPPDMDMALQDDLASGTAHAHLAKSYEDALNAGDSVPKGAAAKIDTIAAEVNKAGDALAKQNGWASDSSAVQTYKASLFKSKIGSAVTGLASGGGGPGGSSTHTAPDLGPVSVPDVPEIGEGESHDLGGGDGIGHLSQATKDTIGKTFHDLPFGTSTSDPIESVFDNLVAVAGWHGKDAGPLSVLQAAQVVDEAKAQKYSSPNKNLTEKALLSWLGTKDGKQYAEAYSTPKADQVNYLKDPDAAKKAALDAQKQIFVANGSKVQQLAGGPGSYDASKSPSDFAKFTDSQAQSSQDGYMAAHNEHWTGAQKKAITAYTGSLYAEINDYLRKPDNNDPAMKKYATQIQAGMRPLAHDQLLIRGSSYKIFPPGFNNIEGVKKLIGEEISDSGFVSTSIAGEGGEFTKAIKLHIEAPAGTMGAYVRSISSHPGENEMILAAGTRFQVLSVDDSGYQPIVRLRVVS